MLSAIALTACSDDTFSGDAPKDWAGTTDFFNPVEESAYSTYYKPTIGRVGDPMPFYDQKAGEFKILYLQEFANNDPSCYHPFYGLTTKDGANYQGLGEVLPTGKSATDFDAALGTGCVLYNEADQLYYIYYTGHTSKEVVMRATSPDFKTWTKDHAWILKATDYGYDSDNFRDPHIFKAEDNLWHMIITTKGRFAEFTSTDLKNWTDAGSFKMVWGNDRISECPDVFKMGNWWYLIFSDQHVWGRCVKYVKAESWTKLREAIDNGWLANDDEGKLDNRGFFAGKTACDDKGNRYVWGWSPYREGKDIKELNFITDDKEPKWSGALVCHKVVQDENTGALAFAPVPGIAAKYNVESKNAVMNKTEGVDFNGTSGKLTGHSHILFERLGYHNHISFTLKTKGDDDKFGLSFVRSDKEDDSWFSVNFNNPQDWGNKNLRRIEFIGEGKDSKGFTNGALSNFVPRPADNTYNIDIFTDNSVVVIYYNNLLCYTTRIYGIQKNCWSINNYGGEITVSDVKVSQY